MERTEAVVVGAGQAGLAVSWHLRRAGVEHLVLERGRVGESWRSQRWDSFTLNTPTWMNGLPGDEEADLGAPLDGFMATDGWVARLDAYAARWELPIHEGVSVTAVEPVAGAGRWLVHVERAVGVGRAGASTDLIEARSVVVASGIQNVPRIPAAAAELPPSVAQLHSLDYRRPADLPPGALLVVGSGQTGGQIVEDLLAAGRPVYLSPSRVPRVPRRHRGRDCLEWLVRAGFLEVAVEALPDPAMRFDRQPIISGLGRYGHTVSLQWLASRGAVLVGRIRAVEGGALLLDDTVADCIRFGDERSAEASRQMDAGIQRAGLPLPPLEDDPADEPHPDPDSVHSPERLDLATAGIGTVVWATGVGGSFDWLPAGLLDAAGEPIHDRGVAPVPGLFYLGFPWLTRRGSGVIHGVDADAALIAGHITRRAAGEAGG